MILTIDTAAGQCGARLSAGGAVHEDTRPIERGHDQHLAPMVAALFARAGDDPRALERVIICSGPGSFAGIRVGIAFGRALAMVATCPSVGVTALSALLVDAASGDVAVRDVRRGEWLWQWAGQDGHEQGPRAALHAALGKSRPARVSGGGESFWSDPGAGRDWQRGPEWPDLAQLEAAGLRATPPPGGARPLYHRPPDAKPPTRLRLPQ